MKRLNINGIALSITPSRRNSGAGYDIFFEKKEIRVNCEGLYDSSRPINERRGELVYLTTAQDSGKPIDNPTASLVRAAIIKFNEEDLEPLFLEFE